MSKKKWTVGDRAAVLIEGPYSYGDEIDRSGVDHQYFHARFAVQTRMHRVPTGTVNRNDSGISILVGDIPFDFVGIKIVELVHQEEHWRSVWKVVEEKNEYSSSF